MPIVPGTDRESAPDAAKSPRIIGDGAPRSDVIAHYRSYRTRTHASARLSWAIPLLLVVLAIALAVGLYVGYKNLDLTALRDDPLARSVFFRLRLPRVLMGAALFRNPLADPFTLGVSGGAALGSSIAIGLGLGINLLGVPIVFLAAFVGAGISVFLVYRLARTSGVVLPGALLLAGVVINLSASAGVLVIQYLADYSRALQILRWMIGSLDVVGFDLILRMLIFLVPAWVVLAAHARDLHLMATGEESAASLGVDVRRTERMVYLASSLIVGVTVAVGGTIGFVGLIVPHTARLLFGQDVRVLLPTSFLLGAAFLVLADALARTVISPGELPVGAITALLGGPVFLWLLRKQQRYSAM